MKFLAVAISAAVYGFGMAPIYGQTVESTNSMQTERVFYNDPFATDKEVAMGNLAEAMVAPIGLIWKVQWTGSGAMQGKISESLRNRIDSNISLSPDLRSKAKNYLASLSSRIRLESEPIFAKVMADMKSTLRRALLDRYGDPLSLEEIEQLTAFYKSAAGVKYLRNDSRVPSADQIDADAKPGDSKWNPSEARAVASFQKSDFGKKIIRLDDSALPLDASVLKMQLKTGLDRLIDKYQKMVDAKIASLLA